MTIDKNSLGGVLALSSLADRAPAEAIDWFGTLVDAAHDAKRADVLRHLATLAETIDKSNAEEIDLVNLDYYLANLWSALKHLGGTYPGGSWEGEQVEIENEIIHLRRALRSASFAEADRIRRCQIFTNLANSYSTTGRFVEAIDTWNDALAIEPRFGMARGNRAVALSSYARALYDEGHAIVMLREAWRELDPVRLLGLEPGTGPYFADTRASIASVVSTEALTKPFDLDSFSLGKTEAEVEYRRWCLNRRLFLNPLNDLGVFTIAAQDVLTCPSIVVGLNEGPRYHGFFNQIKQEFCSARWLAYEAINSSEPHFSDHAVLLYNTLDYPSYSLATEQLKLSFRSLYSLFDKIAFFLNAYLRLGIPERAISFRGIWHDGQQKKKGIRAEFRDRPNWPLRGMYWLAKDLYEDSPDFRSVIDPDAQRLSEVRNHVEHKYLKLHLSEWAAQSNMHPGLVDDLAHSASKAAFEGMTFRLLGLVRAAIIYLSLGVHHEERIRATQRPKDAIIPPLLLDKWDDNWKR